MDKASLLLKYFFEGMKRTMTKQYKFGKNHMLRKNQQFQSVYKAGKSYANKFLVLYILPNQKEERKVGFAVGKRLGGAVIRNRIKRLLRESFRLNQHRFKGGIDLIVIGRQPIVGRGFADVNKALLDVAGRAKIFVE
jgi:ribonuclease P protein component